jgi:2-hydroxychromene-2-carboxylate isomerase
MLAVPGTPTGGAVVAPDLEFFFDVICPFSWQTSRWVEEVRRRRPVEVAWRPVSLALLNADEEDPTSPMGRLHQEGLRLQRVVVAAQESHGPHTLGALYTALGERIWHTEPPSEQGLDAAFEAIADDVADGLDVAAALREAALPDTLEEAHRQVGTRWDAILRTNGEELIARVGGKVGTPVLSFEPPDGPAFFGPVISRPAEGQDAVEVWEAVTTLAGVDGFAEFKREEKALPEVAVLGNA